MEREGEIYMHRKIERQREAGERQREIERKIQMFISNTEAIP